MQPVLTILLLMLAAEAPGWPQWRGPSHNSLSAETDLVDSWPAAGPPVLWSKELGQGYSGIIAHGERIYTHTQTLYSQQIVCLNADTGDQIWSYRTALPYDGGGLYPGPRATPTYSNGNIFYAGPDGEVGCLNANSGKLLWSRNPKREYHGRGTDFGCSASPLVTQKLVLIPVGGPGACLVALRVSDGSTAWKSGDASASYCTPVPIVFQGQRLVVVLLENSLAAFDLSTGKQVFLTEFSQGYDEHAAAPLYQEPFLMIASPFRSGATMWELKRKNTMGAKAPGSPTQPGGEISLQRVWFNLKFSNDVASSVLVQNHVYGFDLKDAQSRLNRPSRGEFRCLNFQTGKIQWSSEEPGQSNIIHADGKLILFNDRGEVILARANHERYAELARTNVFQDEICWTPAALHRGRLFLKSQSRAVCLYLGKQPISTSRPAMTVATVPRINHFDKNLLLQGEREYPATTPEWDEFWSWYCWMSVALVSSFLCAYLTIGGLTVIRNWWRNPVASKRANLNQNPDSNRNPLALPIPSTRIVAWAAIFAAGAFGSALTNQGHEGYVFTWPLCLWAGLQTTVIVIHWCEHQENKRQARWLSRTAGLLLVALCFLYFHLCRFLGLSIEWAFLIGFLPAFPVAAGCAVPLIQPLKWWPITDPLFASLSFAVYFWAVAAFTKWWFVVGT